MPALSSKNYDFDDFSTEKSVKTHMKFPKLLGNVVRGCPAIPQPFAAFCVCFNRNFVSKTIQKTQKILVFIKQFTAGFPIVMEELH